MQINHQSSEGEEIAIFISGRRDAAEGSDRNGTRCPGGFIGGVAEGGRRMRGIGMALEGFDLRFEQLIALMVLSLFPFLTLKRVLLSQLCVNEGSLRFLQQVLQELYLLI
jgi:hypothetical protein